MHDLKFVYLPQIGRIPLSQFPISSFSRESIKQGKDQELITLIIN